MAAVMEVNSTVIRSVSPYWMGETGKIKPVPPTVLRRNGQGLDVVALYASFTWTWEELLITDYTWWTTTILSGQQSQKFSQAKLYNHNGVLTTYANCIVHMPTFDGIMGDVYQNVVIVIDQLQ